MNPIEKLTAAFERFPGIGPRQARRFVEFLLAQNSMTRSDLVDAVRALGSATATCNKCYRWFVKNDNSEKVCVLCGKPSRDQGTLLVVEKEADIDNVERGGFKGLYFVLGGTAPLAEENPERFIRMRELRSRIERDASSGVLKELILGLSATTEGDHTRLLIYEDIRALADTHALIISTLGRGLSTGSELEYADPDTIASALSSRRR